MVLRCLLNHSRVNRDSNMSAHINGHFRCFTHGEFIYIWNVWAGLMAADVSQMLQGSKEGHEGTGFIRLIFWGVMDDRRGRTVSVRSDGSQDDKKSTNSRLSQPTHIYAHSHRQSRARWVDCVIFPHFWQHLSDFWFFFSLSLFRSANHGFSERFILDKKRNTAAWEPPPPSPTNPHQSLWWAGK